MKAIVQIYAGRWLDQHYPAGGANERARNAVMKFAEVVDGMLHEEECQHIPVKETVKNMDSPGKKLYRERCAKCGMPIGELHE